MQVSNYKVKAIFKYNDFILHILGFWKWYRRNNDTYSFVMPFPKCSPNISSLWDCEGFSDSNMIPLSENLCQGEDDIGIRCWGIPVFLGWQKHWKGQQHLFLFMTLIKQIN